MLQEGGDVFVFGEGMGGQLGRGEDVVTAARPSPSFQGTLVLFNLVKHNCCHRLFCLLSENLLQDVKSPVTNN